MKDRELKISAALYENLHGCQHPALIVFIFYFDIHWFIDQFVCLAWQFAQPVQSTDRIN